MNPSRRKFFKNGLVLGTLALPVSFQGTDRNENEVEIRQANYTASHKALDLSPARWIWFPSKRGAHGGQVSLPGGLGCDGYDFE